MVANAIVSRFQYGRSSRASLTLSVVTGQPPARRDQSGNAPQRDVTPRATRVRLVAVDTPPFSLVAICPTGSRRAVVIGPRSLECALTSDRSCGANTDRRRQARRRCRSDAAARRIRRRRAKADRSDQSEAVLSHLRTREAARRPAPHLNRRRDAPCVAWSPAPRES